MRAVVHWQCDFALVVAAVSRHPLVKARFASAPMVSVVAAVVVVEAIASDLLALLHLVRQSYSARD